MEVTAHQLKELDPKRFEKEYWRWTEHAADYEWWDYIEEDFREDCKPMGIHVNRIFFDTYPWKASFVGTVNIATWMKHCKLDEEWYALWLAIEHDGSYARVDPHGMRRQRMEIEWYEETNHVSPIGVFADMDEDDWQEMLIDMFNEAGLYVTLGEFLHDLCKDLARKLEEGYAHQTSEETFLDSCEANEVTFTYEGDDDEIQS